MLWDKDCWDGRENIIICGIKVIFLTEANGVRKIIIMNLPHRRIDIFTIFGGTTPLETNILTGNYRMMFEYVSHVLQTR